MGDQREKCTMCDENNRDPNCYWCSGTGYETRSQDVPVCPHCGAVQSTDELYTTTDSQCDECGGWMTIEVEYTPDYTTSKTDTPEVKRCKQVEEYKRLDEMRQERERLRSEAGGQQGKGEQQSNG